MKNNKGFTLVELIVVITLMTILASVSSYVINIATKQKLKDFTNDLDAMLCLCKVETMSGMTNPSLEVSLAGGEYKATLYENGTAVKTQFLGKDSLEVTYTKNRVETAFQDGDSISFRYDRVTGELKDKEITKISVSDRTGSYAINFVPQTGYHKIVR